MKKQKYLLSLTMMLIAFAGCKKDPEPTIEDPVTYPDFSQLKVGNYWIYQQFKIDANGIATATETYDSCYVEKDTVINGNTYAKVFRQNLYTPQQKYVFLRDSLHYTVNSSGIIEFSSEDFSTVFNSYSVLAGPDTVCQVIRKMTDPNLNVIVPAGTFTTSDCRETYYMYPNWTNAGVERYKHNRYSENVGVVVETLPFYASNPEYVERRLVRYQVN
jgi:hypothetical protein